jgi:hypothetical protein
VKTMPHVVIVVACCAQQRIDFGIRFEEFASDQWGGTWAFPIQLTAAQREGYDRTELRGTFGFIDSFPGCPYCGSQSFLKCGCGKVSCYNSTTKAVTCPWCSATGGIESGAVDSLISTGDR